MAVKAAESPTIGRTHSRKIAPITSRAAGSPGRIVKMFCALAAAGLVSACQTTENDYTPPVQLPAQFTESGEAALPDEWWRSFDDPVLDELIEQALAGSLTIRAAWDRLAQARATATKAGASLFPTLDGEAGASRQRQKAIVSSTNSRQRVTSATDLSLGLVGSYEVDLWGELRSSRDAARFDLNASEEDLKTAAITLSAEVAVIWYQMIEQYGQIDLLLSQAETNEKVLEVVTLRFRRGQVQATDVLRQRQLVESNRGDLILAETKAQVLGHQLAILLGRTPTALDVPRVNALMTLPDLPDTGIPADLVNRRPDIRKAYFDVLAADRRTAAAVADRFPRLTLTARTTTSGEDLRDLFDNWLASLAANLVAPLFDAGERKAEVERTRAVTSQALNEYGQTVLESLGEVEDALIQEANQRTYIASLEKQIELSDQAVERVRDTYISGGEDYLRVLDALLTIQSLERTYLEAQRQLIEFRIDLCRALGGGWEITAPDGSILATQTAPSIKLQSIADQRRGG